MNLIIGGRGVATGAVGRVYGAANAYVTGILHVGVSQRAGLGIGDACGLHASLLFGFRKERLCAESVVDGHGDAAEQYGDGGVRLGAGAERSSSAFSSEPSMSDFSL